MNNEQAGELLRKYTEHMDTPENCEALVAAKEYADAVGSGLERLYDANILNAANREALLASCEYADDMAYCLRSLHRAGIIHSTAIRGALVAAGEHKINMARGLFALSRAGILTDFNREDLIEAGEHAEPLASGFCTLNNAGILDQDSRNTLLAAGEYANRVAYALARLSRARILTPVNRDALLVAGGEHAIQVAIGLARLSGAGILNQWSRDALVTAGEHAIQVAIGLARLSGAGILNQRSRDALVAAGEHAIAVASGLVSIGNTTLHYTEYPYCKLLLAAKGDAAYLGAVIMALHLTGLLTSNSATVTSRGHLKPFSDACMALHASGILEQSTLDALIDAKENPKDVADKIIAQRNRERNIRDVSWSIVTGFIIAVGIAAVAFAFTITGLLPLLVVGLPLLWLGLTGVYASVDYRFFFAPTETARNRIGASDIIGFASDNQNAADLQVECKKETVALSEIVALHC